MSRENPNTDEMLRLTRAREKIRRALTKAAAATSALQKEFEAADAALKKFEAALQQQMMVDAGVIAAPVDPLQQKLDALREEQSKLDTKYEELAARNAPSDEVVPVMREQRRVEEEIRVLTVATGQNQG